MSASRHTLLKHLPPFKDAWQQISGKQDVQDIINEILQAHREFANQYDKIVLYFGGNSVKEICKGLYNFCKSNIAYNQESEAKQTTKSPAAILSHGYGDCKHYASFCGGVLDALNRIGANIKWNYRFASYSALNTTPEHVFIVVNDNGKDIWIDPTPGADKATPVWQVDKKIKISGMPLYRVSGVGNTEINYPVSDVLANITEPQVEYAVQLLLKHGVMDAYAKVNDKFLLENANAFSPEIYAELLQAMQTVHSAAIGGIFKTIWRGVKKVTLAVPRGAFLSLVAINAFGYATKMKAALYNSDGSYTAFKDKLKSTWQDKLGGDWTKLQNTINNGASKRAILGAAPAAAVPAWVAVASAVIAAIMPLVKTFLDQKKAQTGIDYNNIDPTTGMPYGTNIPEGTFPGSDSNSSGFSAMDWIEKNPVIVAAAAVGIVYLMKRRA